MSPHSFSRVAAVALAASSLVSLATRASRAEQFVLFDETFTMTWEDAISSSPSQSHHYVKQSSGLEAQPSNWVSPIDYRNGTVHIYLEVLEKPPGGQEQGWALCYVGKAGNYGCPYTDYYTETGVYERDVSMTNFYNDDQIDWTKGIAQIDLVYTINDSGMGHVHRYPALKDETTPTKVRIAMVQVSAGATYDRSAIAGSSAGAGGGGGGGTAGAGAAGAPAAGGTGGGNGGTAGVASSGSAAGTGATGGVPSLAGAAGASSQGGVPSTTGGSGAGGPSGGDGSSSVGGSMPGAGAGSRPPPTEAERGCSFAPTTGRRAAWLGLALLALGRSRRRVKARASAPETACGRCR